MSLYVFANNAESTLAAPIAPADTSLTLAAGTGAKFPSPTGGDFFTLTLTDAATGGVTEIMLCTARTGDVCTVTRAQEGTTALNWTTGDFCSNFLTAATAATFSQNAIAPSGGTTAARPATPKLYQPYLDTTLGFPIYCTQVSPPIWISASGAVV